MNLPHGLSLSALCEIGWDVRRIDGAEDHAPAGALLNELAFNAGGAQLRQDQPPMIHQLSDSAGAQNGNHLMRSEVSAGRTAPDIDAYGGRDEQIGIQPMQGSQHTPDGQVVVARDQHGGVSSRMADTEQTRFGGPGKNTQQNLDQIDDEVTHCRHGHASRFSASSSAKSPSRLLSSMIMLKPASLSFAFRSLTGLVLACVST